MEVVRKWTSVHDEEEVKERKDSSGEEPQSAAADEKDERRKDARMLAAMVLTPAFASGSDFFVTSDEDEQSFGFKCTLCEEIIGVEWCERARHLFQDHVEVFRLPQMASTGRLQQDTPRNDQFSALCDSIEDVLRSGKLAHGQVISPSFVSFCRGRNRVWNPSQAPSRGASQTNTMTGFCLHGDNNTGRLVHGLPRPAPARDEALVRILRAGICGTDLAMLRNYKPGFSGALGHEFVGIVKGIGDESNQEARSLLGKRVVGEVNIPCEDTEACEVCRNHAMQPSEETSSVLYRNHCPNRQALGMVKRSGAFAEYITLPVANLLVVPDGLPESHAVFVEPLAAAWRVIEQGLIKPSDQVAVLGDGRLGLLVADVLATENCGTSVTIIGKHKEKLRLLQDVVDATLQYDLSLINRYHETFDICIECTGSPSGLASALDLVKPAGRIVMKSTCSVARTPFPTHHGSATAKSVQIIGSRCGPFAPALDLLSSKRIDVQKYLDAVYPLERITEAMAHARRPGVVKVQVAML